jgi:AraC-like DNA-binding protein
MVRSSNDDGRTQHADEPRHRSDRREGWCTVAGAADDRMASRYLTNSTLAIGEVAYLVGFSEPAPFYRAFRRWFSTTPERFRQQPKS